jgi:hypothetical protein
MNSDMQKEMLLQKRNLMMRLRMTSGDSEFKKYDLDSNFDSALVEKKMRRG